MRQAGIVDFSRCSQVITLLVQFRDIPGAHGNKQPFQDEHGRIRCVFLTLALPGFREKEVLNEPLEVLAAARINCGENIFNPPILKDIPQMLLQRSQIGCFQGVKVGVTDVGRFMINQAAYQTEQSFSAIQRQAGQLNDIAVGESLVAADAYLYPVLAAQDGRKQGQRFDDVFGIHRFLQKGSPPSAVLKGLPGSCGVSVTIIRNSQ